MRRTARQRGAFTVIELIVVVGIIAILIGFIVPAIGKAKRSSAIMQCASNLRQLATATVNYLAVNNGALPQVSAPDPISGEEVIVGSLFGGKRGELPMFGIDQWGAQSRPLNAFLGTQFSDEDVPVFHCPLDKGQPAQPPFLPHVESMYDFIGTSYTLNDHALDSERCATLIPDKTGDRPGGRMPNVSDPTKTWMIAPLPIYNYQEGGDRGQRWYDDDEVIVNLAFVDGHVDVRLPVPSCTIGDDGFIVENTTKHYTFLPRANWMPTMCSFILDD